MNTAPDRDRRLNPYRCPASSAVQAVVDEAVGFVEAFEECHGLRQRARCLADRRVFKAAISAIICDLIHRHLTEPGSAVSVALTKRMEVRSRYRPAWTWSKQLPGILGSLTAPELAYVGMEKGASAMFDKPARLTTLCAGIRLVRRIEEHGLALSDLKQSRDEEIIILKRSKLDHRDPGGAIEYTDTDETCRYRAELQDINDWLEQADISVTSANFDSSNRRLYRYFAQGGFQTGGRLFGGFWQNMPKLLRSELIRIEGENTVTLDYGQIVPRIAYSMAGIPMPYEDAYQVPNFEGSRNGIKKLMNAFICAESELKRFPKDTKELFPSGTSFADVKCAIEEYHPGIRSLFFKGKGHETQFIESKILISVLREFMAMGIVALPIHDALVVKSSVASVTTSIMQKCFTEVTGCEGTVSLEGF